MPQDDTICAISTALGEAGIGIIRASGPDSHSIIKRVFLPSKGVKEYEHRRLYLGYIINSKDKRPVDEVLVTLMMAPNTYTREDMAEVYSHGGYAAQKVILDIILNEGARLAEPGEFTKRAFLNGRIDLLQAESVLDIIRSETKEELESALVHLKGTLSERIKGIKDSIKDCLVSIEAAIDFPEEEIEIDEGMVVRHLKDARRSINALIDTYYEGRAIKEGLEVLIVGRPNVGKSSLLNALLLKERAIVTPIPGTTRDIIEDTIYIKGIKLKLQDTAGLRRPKDPIEEVGIERVQRKIPLADLIIWVIDGSDRYQEEDEEIFKKTEGRRRLVVINKIDLKQRLDRDILRMKRVEYFEVSALKGMGMDNLREGLYKVLMDKGTTDKRGPLISNARHLDILRRSMKSIDRALLSIKRGESIEFSAFDLNEALSLLGGLTGETYTDDILETIFERFCIGK